MKKVLLFTSIVAIGLLSCTKQTDERPDEKGAALSVNAKILVTSPTKAIITGTSFANGAKIGVQLRKTGQGYYQAGAMTNIEYTYASAGSLWSTTTPFYLTNTLGEVYAYYPYVSVGDNRTTFSTVPVTLEASATTGDETDYLFATPLTGIGSVNNEADNNDATLIMNHALAQISFYVYKEDYSGTGSLTQFKIEDAAATSFVKTSSIALTMNITDGTIAGGEKGILTRTLSSPVTLTTAVPDPDISVLKGQANATTLSVPATEIAIGNILFTFIIDGETYSATNTSSISWESGKQYIYTARLTGLGIVIVSATITDWTTEAGDLIDID